MNESSYRALSYLRLAARLRAAASHPGSGLASIARTRQAHLHGVSGRESALCLLIDAETALHRLAPIDRTIVLMVGVAGERQHIAARKLGLSVRTLLRRYHETLDNLALDLQANDLI